MITTQIKSNSSKRRSKTPLEKYLDSEIRSAVKHEFYNGKVRKMPGSTYNHNKIAANFIIELGSKIIQNNLSFDIISSDQKIYIPKLNQVLYPDALVVFEGPIYFNNRNDLLLNPILIVEVLSPSTKAYDRSDKFLSYKNIPSFKEYVIVDQDKIEIETWHNEAPHLWRETKFTQEHKTLSLKSIGVDIAIDKIYRNITFEANTTDSDS